MTNNISINNCVKQLTVDELKSIKNIGEFSINIFDNVDEIVMQNSESINKYWLSNSTYYSWMCGSLERRIFIEGLKDMYSNFNDWNNFEQKIEFGGDFTYYINGKERKPTNMILSNKGTNNFFISDYPVNKTKTVFTYYDNIIVAGFSEEDVINYCERINGKDGYNYEDYAYDLYDVVIDDCINYCNTLVNNYKINNIIPGDVYENMFRHEPTIMVTFANYNQVKECVDKLKCFMPQNTDYTTPEWLINPVNISDIVISKIH